MMFRWHKGLWLFCGTVSVLLCVWMITITMHAPGGSTNLIQVLVRDADGNLIEDKQISTNGTRKETIYKDLTFHVVKIGKDWCEVMFSDVITVEDGATPKKQKNEENSIVRLYDNIIAGYTTVRFRYGDAEIEFRMLRRGVHP